MSAEEQQEAGLINEDLERDIGDEVRFIAATSTAFFVHSEKISPTNLTQAIHLSNVTYRKSRL